MKIKIVLNHRVITMVKVQVQSFSVFSEEKGYLLCSPSLFLAFLRMCLHVKLPFCVALPKYLSTELVGELFLDLLDFSRLAIVSQCPCHLLVGHLLAISLLYAPAVC